MKSPHTFPNRSLSRRLLSTFLSLAMVLSLLPVWTLPAMADGGAVIYDRKAPEVSILNAYSGRSEKLYSAIKGDGASAYNGIGLYKRQSTGAHAKYSDRATGNELAWDFKLTSTPVLKKLAQVSNNLQFNTSATFYNRTHTHSHYNWKEVKTYTAEMTVTEKVSATFSGSARVIDGWSDKSRTYPRIGDLGGVQSNNSDGFNTIYYKKDNDYCSLQFSHRTFAWKDFEYRTCTCGGSYAENFVVAFRDTRAPELANVQYSADGESYEKRFNGMSVGKGKSVYIRLTFDEPIRFADDSAAGKGNLYLDLQVDGETAGKYLAQLVELNDSDLIFKYTVPNNQETDVRIAALGMDALFASSATLPLKQVGPNGSFSIAEDIKVNGSTLGLSTTTCYITDLAGNPLQKQTILDANLTLDSGAPYVAKVAFELTCNNTDVKEALGKAGKGPGTTGYDETSYTDNSDLYLGVGDSFYLIVHMNERLKGIERTSTGSSNWQNAVFVTNLLDADGKAVEVTSRYLYPFYDYSTEATQFVTGNITIDEGYHLSDGETQIKVTRMYFMDGNGITLGDITDRAGNPLDKDNVTISPAANANPPMLDTAAPTAEEIKNSYAPEGSGFHYGVTLSDAASGYAGIYGSFILNNNGDGKAYPYKWAVKADTTQVADGEWKDGITGTAQAFMQTQNVYFHIRPLSGEHYGDLSGCTVTVNARDYAGNTGAATLPTGGKLEWYIDNLAPTAAAGSTTRALNSGGTGGTLTAEVILTDGRGISAWQYAWSDSGDSAPADVDWNDGSLSDTASASVTVSAEGDVNSGELFSKYLWVKATDNSTGTNTSAPICLGQYSYDLRDADYELEYSRSFTELADLKVTEQGDEDTLFFLVPAAENSEYYAVYQMVSSGNYNIFGQPIAEDASTSSGWKFYQVTQDNDGNYTLTPDPDRNAASRLTSLLSGGGNKFSGNLAVTVLAGKKTAYNTDAGTGVITLGDTSNKFGEDTVTLRLTGYANDLFGKISLTCDGELGTVHYNSNWSTAKGYQRTTLAGLRFTVSIGGDNRGWRYENVNWQDSYIRLENKSTGSHYDIPIGPFQISGSAPNGAVSQTVTVPEGSYESGVYIATFHLALKAGRDDYGAWLPDGSTYREIAVDTVQPNSDFSLSSVIYDPQAKHAYLRTAYGLDKSYGDGGRLELASDSGIIYLPISKSQADSVYARIATAPKYYVTVTSPTEAGWQSIRTNSSATAYVGCYAVQLWNTAQAGNKVELSTANDHTSVTTDGNLNNSLSFVFSAAEQNSTHLYLAPGEINTVAVQKVYDNGRRSDIKYYQIMPVADAIGGSIRLDKDAKQLVFTPEAGASTAGATVFAWAWQNGQDELAGEGKRVEMSAYADGTWRCALQENGANYEVITVSAHGALCEVGYLGQRTPWFDDGPGNNDNGISGLQFKDNGNGTYTLKFRVRDDQDTMKDSLTADVGFNEVYSKNTFTLTYDGTDVTWTTNDGHPTGIYSAEAKKNVYLETSGRYSRDYLDVTVEGVFAKAADGTTMDITVTATDALGNTGSVSSTGHTVNYVEPKVTGRPSILGMTFNQPVCPVESWAWHEKDGNGFKTEWSQAFPISGNGTWSIQYRDAFSQTHAEEIPINEFTENGKDYSLALSFSTTDITAEAVTMTTNAANGTVKVYEINGNTHTEMTPVDGFPGIGTQKRQTHINENMETLVQVSDGGIIYSLRVYIDNIVSGAPEAQVHYYVQALGQEFTQSELDAYAAGGVTVTGNIRAWYTTARHVTPTGDTGSTFLFTPGGAASHTFTYEDDLGSAGSVTAALPAGLTLQAPVQPQEDTTPPDVDVDIYVKRSGSYTRAEAFLATDSKAVIDDKFDALGYVQGYSLTVNAVDASGFTIAVTGEGAVLSGNTVTITKAGTYTVTVTDKSPNANKTAFTINVPDRIDTTPPTATVAVSATSLYEKTIILTLEDKDDKGNLISVKDGSTELDTVTLDAPADAERTDRNTYKYNVTDNGDIPFLFRDIAGNTGSTAKTISGIDTEPPELTVRWSPSDKKDAAFPPTGPLSTNVTAHIDSSKAMQNLTVRAGNETAEHPLLTKDPATSHTIYGQDNRNLVTITATPERVTVTFKENYDQTLTFTASSANGKSTVVTLNGITVIDKVKPEVDQMVEKRYDRKGEPVGTTDAAYQAVVVLRPSKLVTSANYGATKVEDGQLTPVIYGPDAPLEITFTRNGTYTVLLNDQAGNTTTVPVTIAGIDRTAPELTVTTVEENNQVKATVKVNEPCTVTWGKNGTHIFGAAGSHEITFTQNGTFAITATDAAGNESFKMVRVGSIDNDPPSISFDNSTIYVTEGTAADALKAELDKGYTVWDKNDVTPTVSYDSSAVTLNTAGQYTVTYTVTDKAGNQTTANRFVRVIGADTVCINIDGKLILPDSTAVLRPGGHTLALQNNSSTQPYSIKARRGILSAGQMKYLSGSSLHFDADGKFTVSSTGYYTLLVTTQDRQTIRVLLYVEQ